MVETVFLDAPEMVAIVNCESNFTHYLPSGEVLRGKVTSGDTGVMQISRPHWLVKAQEMNLNIDDLYDNLTMARHIYDVMGSDAWVCKRHVAKAQ